jgi:hypothetical protein
MMKPPKPPGPKGGLGTPVLLNLLVMMGLWLVARAQAGLGSHRNERAASHFFFLLLGLLVAAAVACVALLFIRPAWAAGFALAALLVLLMGLVTCGYSLSSMHIN